MILRPMKAPTDSITDEELKSVNFPLVGSPKLDGFRCLVDERGGLTSSMKFFQNRFVAEVLRKPTYHGLDGEIVVGSPFKENEEDDVFHRTSGPIRRFDGEPDFRFYVFDNHLQSSLSYQKRLVDVCMDIADDGRLIVLEQRILKNVQEVIAYEQEMAEKGYEGAMVRSLSSPYKQGRCTLKEGHIFKRKPFDETDAVIIGFEEQNENTNEKIINRLGLSSRSSHKKNMLGKDTLGAFILKSNLWELPFNCGSGRGLTDRLRKKIWLDKESYLGKTVTVKYQSYGSITKPRIPIFLRFRPDWDI